MFCSTGPRSVSVYCCKGEGAREIIVVAANIFYYYNLAELTIVKKSK